MPISWVADCSFLISLAVLATAQEKPAAVAARSPKDIKFRLIGPFRGGRVVAVAGVPSQPNIYYFGGTGGGVFKTTDGGLHWAPMTDGQIKTGSVGAIAVSESDPNMIYAGMGEGCIRGNASHGDGVYKSMDAGKTWKHMGLADTQQIGRVRVHPKNPDIVYVAALGHMSGPNEERGVFRSTDGGKTWKQVLTRGPKAGAIDLAMDPDESARPLRGLLGGASASRGRSKAAGPAAVSGNRPMAATPGPTFARNPGMPKGVLGRIGVTVSPAQSRARLGDRRSRGRRRFSFRQRRQDLDAGSTSSAICASAPGITRTSSPIRRRPTRCTC